MVSRSMTQVGKWSRRLVSGALVLALAGLLAPATTSARYNDEIVGEEEIEVESDAPVIPPWWSGGYTGGGGSSSGGSGGWGGSSSGGDSAPSDDDIAQQIQSDCARYGGSLSTTEHYEFDTNGNVVDSWFRTDCYAETQYGWVQVWYEPSSGSAEPVEMCSGPLGQPGTCWDPAGPTFPR